MINSSLGVSNGKKNYKKDFDKDLIKRFANTYEFCDGDINKFIFFIKKRVDTYEYMESWERFNKKSLPGKKEFQSGLNLKDITNVDYRHVKRVFKYFDNKYLGDYYDLHVQVIHYFLLMYFKYLEINVLKYMNSIYGPAYFYQHLDEHRKLVFLKKNRNKIRIINRY